MSCGGARRSRGYGRPWSRGVSVHARMRVCIWRARTDREATTNTHSGGCAHKRVPPETAETVRWKFPKFPNQAFRGLQARIVYSARAPCLRGDVPRACSGVDGEPGLRQSVPLVESHRSQLSCQLLMAEAIQHCATACALPALACLVKRRAQSNLTLGVAAEPRQPVEGRGASHAKRLESIIDQGRAGGRAAEGLGGVVGQGHGLGRDGRRTRRSSKRPSYESPPCSRTSPDRGSTLNEGGMRNRAYRASHSCSLLCHVQRTPRAVVAQLGRQGPEAPGQAEHNGYLLHRLSC